MLETDNPKTMLKFFQAEFKNAIKNESLDEIIHNADRLKEYLDKIQLYQADRKHLNAEIKYLRNTAYDMLVSSSEISDKNWVKTHFEEWLVQDFETLNNHLETVIKNPQEIKIRTISTPKKNKGFFEFLNKKQNSEKYIDIKNSPDIFFENLLSEINKAYNNQMPLTMLILLRKLFETVIIDIIWKKYKADDMYLTNKGKFIQFGTVLDDLKKRNLSGDFGHFKEDMEEAIDFVNKLREKGNKSAHRITFEITISEIKAMKDNIRRISEILFRVHANV